MAKNSGRSSGVHTPPNPNGAGWVNQVKGKVTCSYHLKERVIETGRELAQERETEHAIHNVNESIGAQLRK